MSNKASTSQEAGKVWLTQIILKEAEIWNWIQCLYIFFIEIGKEQLTEQLDQFVDFVTGLVEPKKRPELQIKKWHKTVLTGTKIKRTNKTNQKTKQKKKPKKLSRSQYSEMGLFNLPTKSLKYADLLPLHELWLQYIEKQLHPHMKKSENGTLSVPEVYESTYNAFSTAMVKSDFHGAKMTVVASRNPTLVGQTGIVAMETRNTFKIVSEDNRTRSK